jgi:hypothetical protein
MSDLPRERPHLPGDGGDSKAEEAAAGERATDDGMPERTGDAAPDARTARPDGSMMPVRTSLSTGQDFRDGEDEHELGGEA